ncbi:AAA family ATPase [Lysobacter sp. A286]
MRDNELPLQIFSEYQYALDQSMFFGQFAEPGDIGFCVGSGGAGKSRLASLIGPMLYGDSKIWAPGTRPYVLVQLDPADRAYFSPKAFIRDCLLGLDDPFRANVEDIASWTLDPDIKQRLMKLTSLQSSRSYGEPEMRAAFTNLAQLLGVKLMIIDEANMMMLTQRTRVPTDYLESLRRLGDKVGCPILLFGTIKLLGLLGYSAQLNRRTFRIHLSRMSCRDELGAREFAGFLRGIEEGHGLNHGLLTGRAVDVHKWTYGIPGEIVGLVKRARIYAGADKSGIAWCHLVKARHLPEQWKRMIAEADTIESTMEGELEPVARQVSAAVPGRMKAKRIPNRNYGQ